ncbi:hypothetical protein GLIP_0337 [Aliiglaciecola lipolytica E3]|uniref:Uncharacterized protein n=1 Tax=Aliiglaciecola lipolytica E3 TaxID=1127673 RepID=K6Y3Z2_9ALTE|nr:hypothetical protein GLIP_0337 [Aliiglaciecola lipolytica E3]
MLLTLPAPAGNHTAMASIISNETIRVAGPESQKRLFLRKSMNDLPKD